MKFVKLLPVAALGGLAFMTLAPHAQSTPQKIGFVDVQSVIKAHPRFAAYDTLYKQAQTALKPTTDQITALQNKGPSLTAAERQQLDTLAKTYQDSAKTWNDKVNQVYAPMVDDVNKAVAAAAKTQGFTVVMDKATAAQGLVIYADGGSTDLTQAVLTQIKK